MTEFRMHIPVDKDGFILGSQLEQILTPLGEAVADAIGQLVEKNTVLENRVRRLEASLDTERRLRLGGRR